MVIDDILKYARMNKELADKDEDAGSLDTDIRKLVLAQAAELEVLKQRVRMRPRSVCKACFQPDLSCGVFLCSFLFREVVWHFVCAASSGNTKRPTARHSLPRVHFVSNR